jgi:predicted metal-dependent hydrolase
MNIASNTAGNYFDLAPIFKELNTRFFDNKIEALLRWGQKRTAHGKMTIRLGSYHPLKKTITIHPCLDQARVPMIAIERIIFHEMAHQKFPSITSSSGRILVHYPEFNRFEKTYPYLKEADQWIKANLASLLRY